MIKFTEFSPESIERLLNPKRAQLSLFEMQRNKALTDWFKTPRPARIITHSSKICQGMLLWNGDSFKFESSSLSNLVRNNQLLVLVFTYNEQETYTQVTTRDVFHNFFLLGALPLRYHKRFDLHANATLIPVSSEDTYELLGGTLHIRRRKRSTEPATQIHYLVHERATKSNGDYALATSETSGPVLAATLLESSQGGCSLSISSEAAKSLEGTKMVYVSTSLTDGKRVGNLTVYGVIRSMRQTAKGVIVRMIYLDTLPVAIEEFKGSAKRYGFMFEERGTVFINGKRYSAQGLLTVALPLGRHSLKVDWAKGGTYQTSITISPSTANILAVNPDYGIVEQVLPKTG